MDSLQSVSIPGVFIVVVFLLSAVTMKLGVNILTKKEKLLINKMANLKLAPCVALHEL